MKLGSIGRPKSRHVDDNDAARLVEARLGHARANPRWTEIPESRLVSRPPGLLIDAEDDAAYRPWRGAIYADGEVSSAYAEFSELRFYVDATGAMQFLELLPWSWSEQVERRERSRARKAKS